MRLLTAKGNQRTTEYRALSRATVRVTLSVLQALLARAVDDGLIPTNPAARILGEVRKAAQAEVQEIEVFTPQQLATLLAVTSEGWPQWHPFLLCLARTGLRIGEALALEWRDIDFERRVVIVRRALRKGRISPPKNGKSRRVDMSQQLVSVLQGLQSLQLAEAALAGTPAPDQIFSTVAGNAIRDDAFRNNVWAPILRRAGLRYRKPHTLRHTFASMLIEAGEPLTYVQQQLGHHSPAFTLAVYGHLLPRGDRRAVDRLDDATFRNPGATGLMAARTVSNNSTLFAPAVSDPPL